jgi:hypothetical protein
MFHIKDKEEKDEKKEEEPSAFVAFQGSGHKLGDYKPFKWNNCQDGHIKISTKTDSSKNKEIK